MSDDLIERLRSERYYNDWYLRLKAADIIETQAAEIERLTAERDADNKRLKVQRDNALLDMEAFMNRAETAERVLAETVEVLRPFASAPLYVFDKDTLYAPHPINKDWIGGGTVSTTEYSAARNFVKEHGALTAAQNGGEDAGK
jgi:hypothetical protein